MASITLLDDALELAELLMPAWARISDTIPAWHPRNEGEGGEGEGEGSAEGEGEGSAEGEGEGDSEGAAGSGEPDWKSESRKHERRAKTERKAREDLERRLQEIEDSNKSEQQKAIDKARAEAKAEAISESQQERRNDRLEVAVARHAAKTFADVDDALLHIQRGINAGDIDPADIFDDQGKVQTEALKSALDDLLERKPHLKADNPGRLGGSSDAGKGSGGQGLDDMDVEAHLGAIRRTK